METQSDILRFNYWEHFKALKELSQVYAPDHPRIVQLTIVVNDIAERLNQQKSDDSTIRTELRTVDKLL